MKRSQGRLEVAPHYELPTGKIVFGEQPEEAMARIIYDYLGVRARTVALKDAITFTNLRNASEIYNLFIVYKVELEEDVAQITTARYSAYKWVKNEDIASIVVDEASLAVVEIIGEKRNGVGQGGNYRGTANAATIFVDGGSRGNPGPSGIGYYVVAADGSVLKRGGEFIGFSTSRLAEYYALKEGVEQAIELGLKSVRFMSDSLMMVNQMNGVYQVKNKDLMTVHNDILGLLKRLDSYSFSHVPRQKNREADKEAGRAIDNYVSEL